MLLPRNPRFQNLCGLRFGRYVVSSYAGNAGKNQQWLCTCDCGTHKIVQGSNLTAGRIKSCGCLHREQLVARNVKHGHSHRGKRTPEHRVWCNMKARCYTKSSSFYDNYGGRGIGVCLRWHSFANFLEDMGTRPSSKHSIERLNNDADYGPTNCAWVTMDVQQRNKSNTRKLEINGERLIVADIAIRYGIKRGTLRARLLGGMPIEQAVRSGDNRRKIDDQARAA